MTPRRIKKKMSPQRKTGLMCSALSLLTGVASVVNHGWDWLGFLCAGAVLVFIASSIWETSFLKALQVGMLFLIGTVLVFQNDSPTYIGIVILSVSWWYLYTYDFMVHGALMKTLAGITGLLVALAISTEGDLWSITLRSAMTYVISQAIWINAEDLIEKKKRLAILEEERKNAELKEENRAMREAGLILSKEVRLKETGNGPKG